MDRLLVGIFTLLTIASCAKEVPEAPPREENVVGWSVKSVNGYATKSLVENLDYLQKACTPADIEYSSGVNGLGQTIGIWADYAMTIDGQEHEVKDVFAGTELVYNPKLTTADTKWEYKTTPAYWVIGGRYSFRAFYPEGSDGLAISKELSNAKSLVIEMNTAKIQRDMLLAHKYVDTNGSGFNLDAPVELNFRHGMSALRFRFKFYDGSDGVFYSEDAITSCWFEVDEDDSFAITGYMVYGNGLDYDKEGLIQWRNQYTPAKGVKFYRWDYSEGMLFKNALSSSGVLEQTVAVPYSKNGTALDDRGEEFTKQDGWIVVIPQTSNGRLKLCFKTKLGGDAVFSVNIPEKTGTSWEKYKADPYPSDINSQKDADGTDFIPGWRYTYTVSISKTDASVSLSVAPWRRLDSSFDIKF